MLKIIDIKPKYTLINSIRQNLENMFDNDVEQNYEKYKIEIGIELYSQLIDEEWESSKNYPTDIISPRFSKDEVIRILGIPAQICYDNPNKFKIWKQVG